MSVRMALAKLCACTCGGAIIGSGAMQIADVPAARAQSAKPCTPCGGAKKVVRKRHAAKKPVKRIRRVVTTKRVIRTATPQQQVVTQTIPLPRISPMPPSRSAAGKAAAAAAA